MFGEQTVNKMIHHIRNESLSMADGLLGDLGNIDEARNVQARDTTTLDKLTAAASKLVPEFVGKRTSTKLQVFNTSELVRDHYDELYKKLKEQELNDVYFTEEDLRTFILSNVNNNLDINTSQCLGLFTGCLLHFLTERNAHAGEITRFYINGNGNRFDYLFLGAKYIHDLFVENFYGDNICKAIANNGGQAGLVCGLNLKGEGSLRGIGSYDDIVRQVLGITLKGDYVFNGCGQARGVIDQLICVGATGNASFSNLAGYQGHIKQIIGVDISGKALFTNVAGDNTRGNIGDNTRDNKRNNPQEKGTVNSEIYDNIQLVPFGEDAQPFSRNRRVGLLRKNRRIWELANEIKIIELVKELPKSDYAQILRIAEQLYALRPIDYTISMNIY